MRKPNHSPVVRLAMSRPSILFHLKKMGILDDVITRLGLLVEEDDVNFLNSFETTGEGEIYHGYYRNTHLEIDAATGLVSEDISRKRAVGA